MDALELLSEQHDEVDELIEALEKARKSEKKQALFVELADKLAAHAAIEETIFYPAVKARKTEDMLLESTEEHLAIKRVLADMLALDVDADHFDAKLSVLKEEVEHHAREEEEAKLFPLVRKLMSKPDLEDLGAQLESSFGELMEDSPRNNLPDELSEAATL